MAYIIPNTNAHQGKGEPMIKVGDFVKVKDQDIYGFVAETYGNKVVIIDSDSEYEPPDNRLEYRVSELIQKENQ